MHSQVRLSLPPGEQESGSSLNIRPLNTPQLPVELWDEIGEILSENVVATTAQDLLNVTLSCRELFQIFMRHLYKFNKRMIEKSSLSPRPGSESPKRRKPRNGWTERSAMQWAARNGLQGTAQAVREITPDLCQVSHVGVAIRHQHYEFAWMLLKWKEIDEKVAAGVSHDSPIFAAVAMNHAALIEYITKLQGIKVDVFDSDSKTVLHHACENGHLGLVKRFLDMGANPMLEHDVTSRRTFTALEMAISQDSASARVAVVKEIISRKPRLNPRAYMRIIANYDRLDVLDIFIQEGIFETYLGGPESEQFFENWMDTLYEMAGSMAVGAFPRILELCPEEYFTDIVIGDILASACQPLYRRNRSQTRRLTLKISQLLMDHVRVLRNNDLSSLAYEELVPSIVQSIRDDEFLMTEYILSLFGPLKNGQLPLHRNSNGVGFHENPRSSEMLSVLINHGLDVNQTVEEIPLLMHALQLLKLSTDTIGVVKDLVPMTQDIDQLNLYDESTSLMFWLYGPQEGLVGEPMGEAIFLEITELLLDHGASLASRNKKGNTPLQIATGYWYPSVVQLLIDRGADVNATDNRGETALHWATNGICSAPEVDRQDRPQQHRSAIEKVTILIKAHADPDSISDSGSMALRPLPEAWLCHDSFEKMVEIYTCSARDRGDPINVVDFLHRCPSLLRACALIMNMANSGSEKMEKDFEFLLGYGLDIDEHNHRGGTLLDLSLVPGSIPGNSWLFMYLLSKGAKINATNRNGKTVLDRTKDVSIRDLLIRHGALPGSQLEKSVGN